MVATGNPFQGKILLLSPPGSFNAAYIRRSLEFFGIPVLAPAGPATEAYANLDPAEWLTISACVAVDLGKALFADLTQQRQVPFLFVGNDPGSWFPGAYSWLCPPFASFQVVDALTDMIAATGAAMNAALNAAAPDPKSA